MDKLINKSHLVFLPGMDGTGKLFAPLLNHLTEYEYQIIALPQSGPQDYLSLTKHVKNQCPDDDFILIAESFSGPIAAQLAQDNIPELKGIIFVATFLSPPNPMILKLAKKLPIKLLNILPGATAVKKLLFCGNSASPELLDLFNKAIEQVPTTQLTLRIQSIQSLSFKTFSNQLPVSYLLPTQDKLVPNSHILQFKQCFNNITITELNGPHFILQAQPEESAHHIIDFLSALNTNI